MLAVVSYLSSKGIKISPQNEWLVECYNCCINSDLRNRARINDMVYEQWLLADLRDIGEGCIPANIQEILHTTLLEQYALQVDSFLNVGESGYSQFQKIRGTCTKNLDADNDRKTQTTWERESRVLKLTLTDGVNVIFGMEYKPIPFLREPFIPGIKVIITGPVECRRGVLLLEPHHIHVLGGEVDNLLVCNAVENILARKLKLKENPTPYKNVVIPTTETNENDMEKRTETTLTKTPKPPERQEFKVPDDFYDDDDDMILSDHVDQIERSYSQQIISTNKHTTIQSSVKTGTCSVAAITCSPRENISSAVVHPMRNNETKFVPINADENNRTSKRQADSTVDGNSTEYNSKDNVKIFKPDGGNQSKHADVSFTGITAISNDSGISVEKSCFFASGISDTGSRNVKIISKLSDVLSESVPTERCIVCFKGSVKKITSNPRIRDKSWYLTGIVADESANVEVSFCNEFLDKLFGYSSAKMVAEKDILPTDVGLQRKVQQMLKEGKKKLLDLKGQIKLGFLGNEEKPIVLDIIL